ncbi:MAG: ATP-binding protein, partial [Alphaproteobacteria bacterium]|nr:ATP-binding protein [Alphaproteobacteria bacterium]
KLRIGRFTVLAGPNNTGKSFVSKILYSLFDAMNANLAEAALQKLTDRVRREHDRLRSALSEKVRTNPPYTDMEETIRKMEDLAAEQSSDDFEEIDRFIANISNMAKKFPELLRKIRSSAAKQQPRIAGSLLKDFEDTLNCMQEFFDGMTAEKFTRASIDLMIEENLTKNFQIVKSTRLRGDKEGESKFSIPETIEFNSASSDCIFATRPFDFQKLKRYSKVIYLESPMLWKLQKASEALRLSDQHWRTRREQLDGMPKYFYDLASALGEYTDEIDFSDILGTLALLIERKILNKDSFVFMDEPEANLNRAEQVDMAKTLFELAKGGTHVVVATHSADILKWLEVQKEHPKYADLVALNKFSPRYGGI